MRLAYVVLCMALSGCASQQPKQWGRIDGHVTEISQFQADQAVCRGEAQKAALSMTAERSISCNWQGCYGTTTRALQDVFDGCMAGRGYHPR